MPSPVHIGPPNDQVLLQPALDDMEPQVNQSILSDDDEPFRVYKRIAVMGARGSGKSALVIRVAQQRFEETYMLTFHDRYHWRPVVNGVHYDVGLDDTDGQDTNTEFGLRYTTGMDGYVLVFSICNWRSFELVKFINEKLLNILMVMDRIGVRELPRVLVGTQVDLGDHRQVPIEVAQEFARNHGIPYFETSARNDTNVEAPFRTILEIIQNNLVESHSVPSVTTTNDQLSSPEPQPRPTHSQPSPAPPSPSPPLCLLQ